MSMLASGGNAFDAAAAAGFVLQVVEPHQNGPGGEAPMVLYSAAEDQVLVVDGQGPAPARATPSAFEELGLDLVPGSGLLAACVPAAVGSWFALLERFGTMPLAEILAPALSYAEDGFPVLPALIDALSEVERAWAASWPTTAALWLSGGVPAPGAKMRNEPLAATYKKILAEAKAAGSSLERQLEAARRAFYEGFVAEAIDAFARRPAPDELGMHAGLLGGDDLSGWKATFEPPACVRYRDVEVCKTGPWGQGPVLLQQLCLLQGFDVRELGLGSPQLVHVLAECTKLALADREAWFGDPRFADVPLEDLLSPLYCQERRALITEEADHKLRPGSPGGREPRLAALIATLLAGEDPAGPRSHLLPSELRRSPGAIPRRDGRTAGSEAHRTPPGDTCHLDVVDRFGNMVSATPSGGWLQSSPAVPGLGFCLGTRAQMFWLEQGLPNSLAPGKRPRTTLSPSLVLRDGKPALAFGTPGGDQQDQWTVPFLVYHLDFGLGLQEAIDAANWHTNHVPSSFYPRRGRLGELVCEVSLGESALASLRRRGHLVVESPAWSLGRVTAVGVEPNGMLVGGADPRGGQAYAAGR
jgi:gamma-glutamyltranspeptidase/glutathione hydrolase